MGRDIRKFIDNSLLRPDASLKEVEEFSIRSAEAGFCAVCLHPFHIRVAERVVGNNITLCAVVGFPHGLNKKETKVQEALRALEDGAKELDMVMNISAFKSGDYSYVLEEIKAVKRESGALLKVIIETHYLSREEKLRALELCLEGGADFVKTSTGFAPTGASVEDVKLLREASRGRIKIKASGGIRSFETALAMIEAGAERIGTSRGFEICKLP